RPDPRNHFVLGETASSRERLGSVQVWANGGLVRTYEVAYPAEGQSLVQSIRLCSPDASGECLPPTTFEYEKEFGLGPEVEVELSGWEDVPNRNQSTRVLDATGDGRADFLRRLANSGGSL